VPGGLPSAWDGFTPPPGDLAARASPGAIGRGKLRCFSSPQGFQGHRGSPAGTKNEVVFPVVPRFVPKDDKHDVPVALRAYWAKYFFFIALGAFGASKGEGVVGTPGFPCKVSLFGSIAQGVSQGG